MHILFSDKYIGQSEFLTDKDMRGQFSNGKILEILMKQTTPYYTIPFTMYWKSTTGGHHLFLYVVHNYFHHLKGVTVTHQIKLYTPTHNTPHSTIPGHGFSSPSGEVDLNTQ